MMSATADIRPAVVDDVAAIAALHVRVWRETYGDIAPANVQVVLDEKHREAGWHKRLMSPSAGQAVFVATLNHRLVGIVAAGRPSNPIFDGRGEISALYVDASIQRQGLGRRLLAAAMQHLKGEGFAGVGLGVVVGNDKAIAFYTRLGGKLAGGYRDAGPLWQSENLALIWDSTEIS